MANMDFGAMAQNFLTSSTPAVMAPSAGDNAVSTVVGAGEVVLAGMAMGYLNARSPAEDKTYHELFGYPTDVVLGLGGLGLGILMALFGSQMYGHVLRVGIGCLGEAGIRMGFEKGVADRQASKAAAAMTGKKAELRLVNQQTVGAMNAAPQTQAMQRSQPSSVFQHVK